jgi:integrase
MKRATNTIADGVKTLAGMDKRIRELREGKHRVGLVPGQHEYPGLYVEVTANGSRLWRLKFRLGGKEGLYSIGRYPDVGVLQALQAAQEARTAVANDTHPLKAREAVRVAQEAAALAAAGNSFQSVADTWFAEHSAAIAESTARNYRRGLDNACAALGGTDVKVLTRADVMAMRKGITMKEEARLAGMVTKQILDYACDQGIIGQNPADGIRAKAGTAEQGHFTAIENAPDLGGYLRDLAGAPDTSVMNALRFLTLVPSRPVEIAGMRWDCVNFETGQWIYKMSKARTEDRAAHIVPLSKQALALLRKLEAGRGSSAYVFQSPRYRNKPISRASMLTALRRRYGDATTSHGFRATFRSLAHGELKIDPLVLELCLGHRMPGALGEAYARYRMLDERKAALQQWADYLDELRGTAQAKATKVMRLVG